MAQGWHTDARQENTGWKWPKFHIMLVVNHASLNVIKLKSTIYTAALSGYTDRSDKRSSPKAGIRTKIKTIG